MSTVPILCANPDCHISEDGKCLEGLPRETCPNFGRAPVVGNADLDDAPPPEPTSRTLAPSAVLNASAASRLLATRPSRVVSIIATFDAGKTSLIAAMYDAFQRNPVSEMCFAGSSTLHSFELACHDARSASRRDEASMFRTPLGDARFYHLDLCPAAGGEILTLLIADRAGEEYLKVTSDIAHAEPLFEVGRADTLTLLVDGERLIDQKERHNVRAEIEGIVQGLSDADAFDGRQRLAITLTKNDAVLASGRKVAAMGDFDRIVTNIRERFAARFAEVEAFVTAASPKKEDAKRGEGLPELLNYWVKPVVVPGVEPVAPVGVRDFDRLKEQDA